MSWKITGAPGTGDDLLYSQAGTPTLDLRFASSKSLNDNVSGQNLITFTRSGNATYFDADGVIQTAGTNTARFDHDPATGESLGLLIEEQRTNLLLRSEEFNDASWNNKINGTVTSNAGTAPNGLAVADRFTPDAVTALPFIAQNATVVSGTTYAWSVFLKADGYSWVFLDAFDGSNHRAWFDLSTGTIGTVEVGNTATITPVGNGWYRCTVARSAGATSIPYAVAVVSENNAISIAADGTSGILLYGAQLEAGAFPTSYIPTAGTTVTRNADVASISGSNLSGLYRQDQGTFYADAIPVTSSSVSAIVLSASDGTSTNRHTITRNITTNITRIFANVSGVIQTQTDLGVWVGRGKVAYGYATNDFAGSFNGASPVVDTSATPPVVSDLFIGKRSDVAANSINGTISRISYFDRRLPNATLQAITA